MNYFFLVDGVSLPPISVRICFFNVKDKLRLSDFPVLFNKQDPD